MTVASHIAELKKKHEHLSEMVEKAQRACDFILTWDDPNYPRLLKEIPQPPPVLYIKGNLKTEDEWALAVVGTRSASAYGKETTRTLVSELARNKMTIVSGLARGIGGPRQPLDRAVFRAGLAGRSIH